MDLSEFFKQLAERTPGGGNYNAVQPQNDINSFLSSIADKQQNSASNITWQNSPLAQRMAMMDEQARGQPVAQQAGVMLGNAPGTLIDALNTLAMFTGKSVGGIGKGIGESVAPFVEGVSSSVMGSPINQNTASKQPQPLSGPASVASFIPQQFLPGQDGQSAPAPEAKPVDMDKHYKNITKMEAILAELDPEDAKQLRPIAAKRLEALGAPSDLVSIYSQHGGAAPVVHQEFQAKMDEQKRKAAFESMKPEQIAEREQAQSDARILEGLKQMLVTGKAADVKDSNPELIKNEGGMWVTGWGSKPVKDIPAIMEYLRKFAEEQQKARRKTPKASDVAQKYGTLAGKK